MPLSFFPFKNIVFLLRIKIELFVFSTKSKTKNNNLYYPEGHTGKDDCISTIIFNYDSQANYSVIGFVSTHPTNGT